MAGLAREAQLSFVASSIFPGFRFSPTDEELISYYLKKKLDGHAESVQVISEIEICRYEPWDLPARSVIQSEKEWFFFSCLGRKYPNGLQSKRATESGYWKATGKERNVKSGSNVIGTKRTLVFHLGRAPKAERTEWIMHEYCILDKSQDSWVVCRLKRNTDFRLNDASNRDFSGQRTLVTSHDSGAVSDVGLNGAGASKRAITEVGSSRSYGSHSMEQIDYASASSQKQANEFALIDSSSLIKETDEEDYFADILKDEIVKLDESSKASVAEALPECAYPDLLKSKAESSCSLMLADEQILQDNVQEDTAQRRIRLRKHKSWCLPSGKANLYETPSKVYVMGRGQFPSPEQQSNASFSAKTTLCVAIICLCLFACLWLCIFLPCGEFQKGIISWE